MCVGIIKDTYTYCDTTLKFTENKITKLSIENRIKTQYYDLTIIHVIICTTYIYTYIVILYYNYYGL